MRLRKGMVVKLKADRRGNRAEVWRRCTAEETAAWYASDASKGMDCAGESKLPPQDSWRRVDENELFKVVKARHRTTRGWHTVGGCVLLEDATGEHWATRRDSVDVTHTVAAAPATKVVTVETWDEAKQLTVTKGDVRAHVDLWLERVNTMRRERAIARFSEDFVATHHDAVTLKGGRKWLKMVAGGSVYCFVESATGNIYKAASYSQPATNFPRGSIFVEDVTHAVSDHGANYAR